MISWLLRHLHWLEAQYHFEVQLLWVDSASNEAADAASREEWDRFFRAVAGRSHLANVPLIQVSDQMLNTRRSWSSTLRNLAQSATDMQLPQ